MPKCPQMPHLYLQPEDIQFIFKEDLKSRKYWEQRHISSMVADSGFASGRKKYLPEESKKQQVSLIKLVAKRVFPLSMRDVQGITLNYAKANNIKGFSEVKGTF